MTQTMNEQIAQVKKAFEDQYNQEPRLIVRAPGRVNLIGEHTDYNDGFVFPAAINRQMIVAIAPNNEDRMVIWSEDYHQKAAGNADGSSSRMVGLTSSHKADWANYFKAVVQALIEAGHKIHGFNAVIYGDVPQGAGLSSSAAYEVAACTALSALYGLNISGKQVALLAQRAENQFIGVKCGIMDQFVSALGEADSALLIDCRSLDYEPVPLALTEENVSIVITNSGVRRGLVDSEYNARRSECEQGVALLKTALGRSIQALRDVSLAELTEHRAALPELVAKRCHHVVSENERVLRAVDALKKRDLNTLGMLLYESHKSLRDDFEVSCPELDILVDLTSKHSGTIGSRMTGAGFGGCTVSLIKTSQVDSYIKDVLPVYEERTGKEAQVYVCEAAQGASIIEADSRSLAR